MRTKRQTGRRSRRPLQRLVGALIGKPVWLPGERTPRYIHNIQFGVTDRRYRGQPKGVVILAHSDLIRWESPNTKLSDERPH